MLNLIPFLLVLLSLAVIIVIVIRKFPQLSLLDVGRLPKVQEERKKNEFLRRRVREKIEKNKKAKSNGKDFFTKKMKNIQFKFRKYVGEVERIVDEQKVKIKKPETPEKKKQKKEDVKKILQEAKDLISAGSYDMAEQKFIFVISLESNNKDAFAGLGEVYLKQKQFKEAEETYKFLLQLDPQNDLAWMKLAQVNEEMNELEEAVENLQKAVLINDALASRFAKLADLLVRIDQSASALEAIKHAVFLEAKNPKYLDKLVETSIMVGDKKEAKTAYDKLRLANPENSKLTSFKSQISELR
ncbi:MAG: tetratricopeptide repeat protein [Candidatus Magasanikbacteria bacterium]|nr:tetratricopeptide repeat protein [Candidatus Magasanikbacteria bacterium]